MGNYVSCTLSGPGSNKNWSCTKVIFPSGEIQQFQEAIKAAELMLEMPSFFVVNTRSLQIGRRFFALNADEELEFGNVYLMVSMTKLNSVVTASDKGALLLTAKRVSGGKGKVRIVPSEKEINITMESSTTSSSLSSSQPKLNLDDIEDISNLEFMLNRLSLCRSKKPLLETIAEEPVCSK